MGSSSSHPQGRVQSRDLNRSSASSFTASLARWRGSFSSRGGISLHEQQPDDVDHPNEDIPKSLIEGSLASSGEHATSFEGCEQGETASTGLTFFDTVSNFVIGLVGAGVLVLPRMVANVGFGIAVPLMLLAVLAICKCALMTISCCDFIESSSGECPKNYEAVASSIIGVRGKAALAITKNVYLLGVIVVYILLEVDGLSAWMLCNVEYIRWCMVVPVFVALAMFRNLKIVARIQPIGILAAIVQSASICTGAVDHMFDKGYKSPQYDVISPQLSLFTLGSALATCSFGFSSIVLAVPSVRSQMANRAQAPSAVCCALAIVFMIYFVVMGLGYASFGRDVQDNIMDNFTDDKASPDQHIIGSVSAASIIINLLTGVPTLFWIFISVVEASGSGRLFTPLSVPNVLSRVLLVLCLGLVSALLPFPKQVIGLFSAAFGVVNAFAYPLIFHYTLKKRYPEARAQKRLAILVHVGIAALGSFAFVFGVLGSVETLREKLKKAQHAAAAVQALIM